MTQETSNVLSSDEAREKLVSGTAALLREAAHLPNAAALIESLNATINHLQDILGAAYQMAGVVGAPVRFLDALSRYEGDIETLLPVSLDEFEPEWVAAMRRKYSADEPPAEYQLPCDVHLPPNTYIGRGALLSTLLTALKARERSASEFPVEFTHRAAQPPGDDERLHNLRDANDRLHSAIEDAIAATSDTARLNTLRQANDSYRPVACGHRELLFDLYLEINSTDNAPLIPSGLRESIAMQRLRKVVGEYLKASRPTKGGE